MEDAKLQALHDSLAKLRGGHKKGLGGTTRSGSYSWSNSNTTTNESAADQHPHGLPNNQLYSYFAPEGTYNPNAQQQPQQSHGDGRFIKRNFDDIHNGSSDSDSHDNNKGLTKSAKEGSRQGSQETSETSSQAVGEEATKEIAQVWGDWRRRRRRQKQLGR